MLRIEITTDNYEFYNDVYSYGCDMLYSKNKEEKEEGGYIFHASMIEVNLLHYSDEVLMEALSKALDDYETELKKEEEEEEEEFNWWEDAKTEEYIISGYGWD